MLCTNTPDILSSTKNMNNTVRLSRLSFRYEYDQTNSLKNLNITFEKIDIDKKEIYILGNFNINMYHNNRHIFRDDNTISWKFLSDDHYYQFCSFLSWKQLIQSLTPVTCSTSTLNDHILISVPSRVSQKGVINVGVPDH